MADPTMEFLKDLDNPSKWYCVKNVPINRPHEIEFEMEDGTKKKVKVTTKDLPHIASVVNKAYQSAGVPVRATLGHVKYNKDTPEHEQPKMAGYFRNAKVGTFGPENTPAVLADLYVRLNEARSILAQYPFRSMEYDPATKRIHGVALLTRNPMLDLGVVTYQDEEWVACYEFPPSGDKNPKEDDVAPETADPAENPPADDEVDDAEEIGDVPGDGEEQVQMDDTGGEEAGYQSFVKCMQRYIASGGMASMGPNNAGMPTAQAIPPAGEAPAAYQKPTKGKPVSTAIDTTVKALEAKVAAMQKDRDTEASKRLLDPIQSSVKFNYQRELEVLISLPSDDKRTEHVAYMAENYAELPTARIGGPMIRTYAGPAEGKGGPITIYDTPPLHEKILAYMHKNKVEYLDAKEKVEAAAAMQVNGVSK